MRCARHGHRKLSPTNLFGRKIRRGVKERVNCVSPWPLTYIHRLVFSNGVCAPKCYSCICNLCNELNAQSPESAKNSFETQTEKKTTSKKSFATIWRRISNFSVFTVVATESSCNFIVSLRCVCVKTDQRVWTL